MTSYNTTDEPSRFDIEPESDASAGWLAEYPYQAVSTAYEPGQDMRDPDTIAAIADESRSERNREKHVQEVTT